MKPRNLVEMLHLNVKRFPGKNAIMWKENGTYRGSTYSELWETIRHFALGLQKLGIRRGSKVAIFSENGPRWLISDFAILSLGAVSVPIYPTLTGKQVEYILRNADVEVAIVQNPEMVKRVEWPSVVQKVVLMHGQPSLHKLVVTFDRLLKEGRAHQELGTQWEWEDLTRSDLATIVHTSGTTGQPKGVMLSHGNILSNIEATQHFVPVSSQDTNLSFLPLSHIFERTAGHFTPMYVGGTIAYAESLDTVPQNLLEVKPTAIISVPRLFEKIYGRVMEQRESGSKLKRHIFDWAVQVGKERYEYVSKGLGTPIPPDLQKKYLRAERLVFSKIRAKTGGNLRLMVSGGAALEPEIARFFAYIGLPIIEGYGMTECSPVIACNPLTRVKPGTVGKPLPGTEVRITDEGELTVKSPSVMMGYYKQPEETEKTIVDGWLHTGDIVKMDQEGYMRIIDRKKNIFVLSTGKNVAPQPLESTLASSRYIHQAVLVGNKRKYVSALIVPDYEQLMHFAKTNGWAAKTRSELAKSKLTRDLIQDEINRLLVDFAPFERPKRFTVMEEEFTIEKGELTPTLKVRMNVIEKKYAAQIAAMYDETHPSETSAAISKEKSESTHSAASSNIPTTGDETKTTSTDTRESSAVSPPQRGIPVHASAGRRNTNWVSTLASAVTFAQLVLNPRVIAGILIGVAAGIVVKFFL